MKYAPSLARMTSFTKVGVALVNVKLARTLPVRVSITRPFPPAAPATNRRPNRSTFIPSEPVPGPWLITLPRPVRRSAA